MTVVSGEPFISPSARIVGGVALWPTREVTARLMDYAGFRQRFDLAAACTMVEDGADLVVSFTLSGFDTQGIRSGPYRVYLSDPGPGDEKSVRCLWGEITVLW